MTSGGRNRIDEKLRKRAVKMVKDGHTAAAVARKLNISETSVFNWTRPKRERKQTELPEFLQMLHAWPQRTSE